MIVVVFFLINKEMNVIKKDYLNLEGKNDFCEIRELIGIKKNTGDGGS